LWEGSRSSDESPPSSVPRDDLFRGDRSIDELAADFDVSVELVCATMRWYEERADMQVGARGGMLSELWPFEIADVYLRLVRGNLPRNITMKTGATSAQIREIAVKYGINPPDTPDDIQPVPFEERPVFLLKLNKKQLASLGAERIVNLGTLGAWLDNHDLAPLAALKSLAGFGPKSAQTALETFELLRGQEAELRSARERTRR
jgi:hypothetical protein